MMSENRYNHCVNVSKEAVKLAKRYGGDEEKAAVVRQIFDLAEQGIWPSKIKQYLNKNGVPGCAGGDWK